MNHRLTIAIDGPAAAGKSTIAKRLAKKLNYTYVDTGAMYRALTYKCLQKNVDLHREEEVISMLHQTKIELKQADDTQEVFVDGKNVSDVIRTQNVSNHVSIVAQIKEVRKEMVELQRQMATEGGVVMDGRDIATNVLPNADIKVFMVASVSERARRRLEDLKEKGEHPNLLELEKEIARRDKMDSERKIDPLKKAEDAVEIDSTHLTIDEVVKKILKLVDERIG
ncbi:(d)CMP kinase [Massilibacterium senegalense]|uniref:(d)CMP kinase n=1 Tax=Massilibacterium senegalense TaxID=1632858 RepID=UPI000780FB1D|nr:(d)CMP kinase [Massilibacterium senegalense]